MEPDVLRRTDQRRGCRADRVHPRALAAGAAANTDLSEGQSVQLCDVFAVGAAGLRAVPDGRRRRAAIPNRPDAPAG